MSIYAIAVRKMDGQEQALSDYKGKVLLVVNTATGCGFTPQYAGLQALYEKYGDRGFEILDFPCNQFGNQAPDDNEAIHAFCTGRFGITFPQFAKVDVNGANEAPLFAFLKKEQGGLMGSRIKWNFTKFLVDRSGNVVGRFAPTDAPEKLDAKIAAIL